MTAEQLREVLAYHPETGMFNWKKAMARRLTVGQVAGCIGGPGYIQIWVKGRRYYGHRLAWFHYYGKWPENEIDHRNGIKTDNRIANLREANSRQNKANAKPKHQGLKGTTWDKNRKKWHASICYNRKTINLGRFNTEEEAHEAYIKSARSLHGEFARAA